MFILEVGDTFGLAQNEYEQKGFYSTSGIVSESKDATIMDPSELKLVFDRLKEDGRCVRIWMIIPDIDGKHMYVSW
jgi:hypothetical protein